MDSASSSRTRAGKGKARADSPASERTPLLATQAAPSAPSPPDSEDIDGPIASAARRRKLISLLIFIFSISLAVCVVVFFIIAVLLWSYASRASGITPDDMMQYMVVRGPSNVDVLNVTSTGGLWVYIEGEIGVNAGGMIGVNSNPYGDGVAAPWKALGRWGVSQLNVVSIQMSSVQLASEHDGSVLAVVDLPPMEIPLTSDPPRDSSWLHKMSATIFVQPSSQSADILRFARDSWQTGSVNVVAKVQSLEARGGSLGDNSWRRRVAQSLHDVRTVVKTSIPALPGLPAPGSGTAFPSISSLVTLQSFGVFTHAGNVALTAQATMIDPAPSNINLTTPQLDFSVSLPRPGRDAVPIAAVTTQPFSLTHPNITLNISGSVVPLPEDASVLLSTFLARYLSAEANPVSISTSYIPGLNIDMLFPAPSPPPHILRNVTIQNMRIVPYGTTFLASGSVLARVVLPRGMNVDVDVKGILPDVLVFDGEVPDDVSISVKPPVRPLPDPLPPKAFGHIVPDDWLDAISVRLADEEGEGAIFSVSAEIVDVPLQVLPGRSKEFSSFVQKVIFGHEGATAGLLGSTSVGVQIPGLPMHGPGDSKTIEMSGLPFRGSVNIGKRGLVDDALRQLEHALPNWIPMNNW